MWKIKYLYYITITCNMPRHYEKKERTRRIMYRQDDIARAMTDVQEGMSILVDVDIDVQDVENFFVSFERPWNDASTSGTNQRDTPQEEIQDLPELPDLEESFDETSSAFNNRDYVLVKLQQGKLEPYFYVGKVLSQIDDKVTVKFL
ncbi:hypothetical protein Avbf_00180 [Armadillidium vulgare]|nr:hypothetical protein Avbf_00180 [Armadillidium vulgare]